MYCCYLSLFVLLLVLYFVCSPAPNPAFFLFLWPCCVTCELFIPQPGVRVGPLGLEYWVQDAGPADNNLGQGILIWGCSSGGIHLKTKTQLYTTAWRLQCQTPHGTLRISSTYESTGRCISHKEAYLSPWTNLTHQGADNRIKRNYDLQLAERRP